VTKRSFAAVVSALSSEPGVTHGKMMASVGLKVEGKIFAMDVKGSLVVKLPASRVEELRARDLAAAFDPGHGRVMREWASVSSGARVDWVELSREALAFVRSGLSPAPRLSGRSRASRARSS
jgi:hypothetical protein